MQQNIFQMIAHNKQANKQFLLRTEHEYYIVYRIVLHRVRIVIESFKKGIQTLDFTRFCRRHALTTQ